LSYVDVDVIGDEKVALDLEGVIDRAKDARPATKKVKAIFIESNRKTFESEGSHIGAPWAPLAEATKERKSREGLDPRPLRGKTGDLEASMTGGRGKRTGATKTGARAGSSVWYSVFTRGAKADAGSHNTGIPARKLAGVTRSEEGEILTTVATYIVHGR
jgi:phage gpG-like protein